MKTILITFLLSILTAFSQGIQIHSAILYGGVEIGLQPWYPTNLSGCTLWLAADQSQLSGYSDGDAVTNWTDNSGNGFNQTNWTTTTTLLFTNAAFANGKPALMSFTNRGTYSVSRGCENYVATNENHIFVLCRAQAGYDWQNLFRWFYQNDSNAFAGLSYNGGITYWHSSAGTPGSFSVARSITNNAWWMLEFVKTNSSGHAIYTNGVFCASTVTDNTNLYAGLNASLTIPYSPNSTRSLAGELAEIIFYNRLLTGNDPGDVRAYLTNKYGL